MQKDGLHPLFYWSFEATCFHRAPKNLLLSTSTNMHCCNELSVGRKIAPAGKVYSTTIGESSGTAGSDVSFEGSLPAAIEWKLASEVFAASKRNFVCSMLHAYGPLSGSPTKIPTCCIATLWSTPRLSEEKLLANVRLLLDPNSGMTCTNGTARSLSMEWISLSLEKLCF